MTTTHSWHVTSDELRDYVERNFRELAQGWALRGANVKSARADSGKNAHRIIEAQ